MDQLKELQLRLEGMQAPDGLRLVSDLYGSGARFSTSLGMEDQVITHWIGRQKLSIEVFTLDTGRLFQETYDLLALSREKYELSIKTYVPDAAQLQQLLLAKGPNSFYHSIENRKECCAIRKVEPLGRALRGAQMWITGIRADQSGNRGHMSLVEWDEQHQLIKYNPLLHWSIKQVEDYIETHRIPVSKLHKKGFASIGCAPCTRAVAPGEDIRAGRWWWETSSKECGLHETLTKTTADA